jgi:general secretion pathway protein K
MRREDGSGRIRSIRRKAIVTEDRGDQMREPVAVGKRSESGFILVAVLWILAALAILASIYAVYARNMVAAARVHDDRLVAEALINAATELTVYRLTMSAEGEPNTKGTFAFRSGLSQIAVAFSPETARIDINAAPKELLAGLFATLGAKPEDAVYYSERIIGWRTRAKADGDNEEASAYRTAGLRYKPRQAPFQNVGELWLVLGLPSVLVEHALPFLTVFSGRPQIDAASAAPEVIAALSGMTSDRLYAILAQRSSDPENEKALQQLLGSAAAGTTAEAGKTTRIDIRVNLDTGRQVNADIVILLLEDGDEPYRVLAWHDDFDSTN